MIYKIVIVDDHTLVSSAIRGMVDNIADCEVLYEVTNGQELFNRIENKKNIPDLILLDINMPVMDGFETMKKLHTEHPDIRVLGLSMNDDEASYMKLITLGANGFLSKVAKEEELQTAIHTVFAQGYYYTEEIANSLFRSIHSKKEAPTVLISDREKQLLSYICTEKTYQEIAAEMFLSPKTIDGYRNSLFQKLGIKSRVGLAMYAVREGYYDPASENNTQTD